MAQRASKIFLTIFAAALCASGADARHRSARNSDVPTQIVDASPTLAPFQHVRFCLRYPADCQSNPTESERIDLDAETQDLVRRVNLSVNASIIPSPKSYGPDLEDGWTIAPSAGDCNDYAVTKRHALLEHGLPAKALRLSVVRTASGTGHLVLVVVTTKGDIVLDNLTDAIRPWQSTDYQWIKIQSASDSRFWHEVKAPSARPGIWQAARRIRLANR